MANILEVDRINNVIVMGTTGTTTRLPFCTASRLASFNGECDIGSTDIASWIIGTANQITVTDEGDGTVTLSIPSALAVPGKVTAGSFGSPIDVTNTREYGFELHYSGNNYNTTAIRARAHAVTTDTSAQFQGGLFQAANNDNINVGVLNGLVAEAIGKADTNAATITMMRGALIGAEWSAKDTVTDLRTLHVRTHTRDAATEGYISDTGYGIYIENEAVGGNGQALDAGIYFKDTNISGGNSAFTYGIDFSGGTYGTADIKLSDNSVINDSNNRWGIGTASPGTILEISKAGVSRLRITNTDNSLSGELITGTGATPGFWIQTLSNHPLYFTTANGSAKISLVSGGKVGIGTTTPKTLLTVEGALTLKEQAAADGSTAAYGQIWIKSDSPNILMFTDDAGTDFTIDVTAV